MKMQETKVPKNWEIKKLGEVCTHSKGKKPKFLSSEKSERNSIPYINIKAFEKGIFDEYTDGEKCNLCEEGDLLMVWDGARAGFTGKAKKGAIGSTLMKINAVEGVEKNYIYYFLISLYKKLNTNPRGVGIPHVEPTLLWNSELVIPPLPEQQAIVQKIEELFSELDKSIENLKTAQQQIKTYRQSVLKSAFEGKLTSKKEDENLMMVAEPNLEYGDNKLPEGWKWVKVSDISTILGDGLHGTPKYDELGEYYFINGNNLSDGKIEIKENTKRINKEEYLKYKKPLNERTVLVSINGTLGNVAFFNNENVILGKSACYFNLHEEVEKLYIKYLLQSNYFIKYANETATGSTIKNVSLKSMRAFAVPLASQKEQKEIVSEIESRLSVADKLEESINQSLLQAETLRQSILKRAFEGKLI